MLIPLPTHLSADLAYGAVFDDIYFRLGDYVRAPQVFFEVKAAGSTRSITWKTASALVNDATAGSDRWAAGRGVALSLDNRDVASPRACVLSQYQFSCITAPKGSLPGVATTRALSVNAVVATEPAAESGYLRTRIAFLKEIPRPDTDVTWPAQYANPVQLRTHWARTARKSIPLGDHVSVAAGTGGTPLGCTGYLRTHSPSIRDRRCGCRGTPAFGKSRHLGIACYPKYARNAVSL